MPSSSVSPDHTIAESNFWLYIVYVLSTVVLYVSCLTTLFFLVSKSEKSGIKSFTKDNPEVLKATIIVIGSFVVVEILAELVMTIVWTVNVKHPFVGLTIFAAAIVYYCPGIFSVCQIIRKCYRCYYKFKEEKKYSVEEAKNKALFKSCVWVLAYFAYILLYSFFPAFMLAFAYPTRVITIFAFIVTFLLLSIVYLTTYIKKVVTVTLKILKDKNQDDRNKKDKNQEHKSEVKIRFIKVITSIILIILLLYFFLLIFALLYALVIGRASVVSSAPLALLSLLPSILISIAAWVMKSTLLKNDNDTYNHGKNEKLRRISKRESKTMGTSNEDEENQDGVNEQDEERHEMEIIEEAGQNRDTEV